MRLSLCGKYWSESYNSWQANTTEKPPHIQVQNSLLILRTDVIEWQKPSETDNFESDNCNMKCLHIDNIESDNCNVKYLQNNNVFKWHYGENTQSQWSWFSASLTLFPLF